MISVCIATYNGEKYIRDQLISILSQLSADDEVIISDDCSTDNTLKVIASMNDSRIRVLSHTPVKGSSFMKATANFENALKQVRGDYIFLADQDDIWCSNKVQICLHYLKESICVQSKYQIFGAENLFVLSPWKERHSLLGNIIHLPFRGCCMAFRKELLKYVLPIPSDVLVHDAWIGCLAFMTKKYIVINQPLINYRVHGCSVSVGKSQNTLFFKCKYRLKLLWNLLIRFYLKK